MGSVDELVQSEPCSDRCLVVLIPKSMQHIDLGADYRLNRDFITPINKDAV